MSADWVETVRRAFALTEVRDLDALLELHHPRVEIVGTYLFAPVNTYHGHNGVRRSLADIDEGFDKFDIDLEEVRQLEGRVLVTGTITATAKVGETRREEVAWLFGFEDDKIRSVRSFRGLERAMQALRAS